jgi:uncharacterized protein YndB with AHSA1/START domain
VVSVRSNHQNERPRTHQHHRVIFRWGIRGSDAPPPGGSTVEVVLIPDGDDTMVVLTHRGLPSTHIGGHRAGWEHQLGQLPVAAG